jgi:ABC-type spermidine/putrescine transport system permease subunit I
VLAGPLFGLFLVAYLLPMATLIPESLGGARLDPSIYRELAADPLFQSVLIRTFRIALEVTVVVLLIAYPTAYLIWRIRPGLAGLLLALVLFPLWTSLLVRTYAWTVVLGRTGIVNEILQGVGLTHEPVRLLNTEFAVLVGMVHVLVPFAILPIYNALRQIDPVMLRASSTLGASTFRTFRYVVVPLSLPGVVAGLILVFVLSLGFYVTPAILGGPQAYLVANLIAQQVTLLLDFGWGAAIAFTLLVLTLGLMAIAYRTVNIDRLLREGT